LASIYVGMYYIPDARATRWKKLKKLHVDTFEMYRYSFL
jgi:hypothetical protein